ncbi:hypothetical protein AAMO2058_000292800 [Amorphochlora amoebiformis]
MEDESGPEAKMAKRFQKYLAYIEFPASLKRIIKEIADRVKVNPDFDVYSHFSLRLYEIGKARARRLGESAPKAFDDNVSVMTADQSIVVSHADYDEEDLGFNMRETKELVEVFGAILKKWGHLGTAWKVLDRNGDSKISRDEFDDGLDRSGLEWICKTKRDLIWTRADLNGDNVLDYPEFKAAFHKWVEVSNQHDQQQILLSRNRVKEKRKAEKKRIRDIKDALATSPKNV